MAQKIGLTLLLVVAAALSLRLLVPWAGSMLPHTAGEQVTYICTETKMILKGPAEPEPALNPRTGRRTLVRAMYSTQGKQWVPAPPEQVLRQNRQRYAATDGSAPLTFAAPGEAAKAP